MGRSWNCGLRWRPRPFPSLRATRPEFAGVELGLSVVVAVPAATERAALSGGGCAAPLGIAPMGGTSMAAFRGDVVRARAAAQARIPMIMSGASLTRLEDVRAAGGTAWFQAYLPGETGPITRLLERVAPAGFDTLVLTVDVPVSANREHHARSGFSRPLRPTARLAWDSALRPRC